MRTEAIDWLGVLATDEEIRNSNIGYSNCFVNKMDSIQFYLKVISKMPGQNPKTQYVGCYGNRIDSELIVDNGSFDENVRIKDYVKQLTNCFFRFNYEKNQSGYFIAKNIETVELSESYYQGNSFFCIPMIIQNHQYFSDDKKYDSHEQLEQAIQNGEYICKFRRYNTSDMENIPYIIFYDSELLEYHIIGNFTKFEYNLTEGIKFEYNELKSFSFEDDWYDSVVTFGNTHTGVFLGEHVHKKIMDRLDEEIAIDIRNQDEKDEEELGNIFQSKTEENSEEWEFIEHFDAVAKKNGLFLYKKGSYQLPYCC